MIRPLIPDRSNYLQGRSIVQSLGDIERMCGVTDSDIGFDGDHCQEEQL